MPLKSATPTRLTDSPHRCACKPGPGVAIELVAAPPSWSGPPAVPTHLVRAAGRTAPALCDRRPQGSRWSGNQYCGLTQGELPRHWKCVRVCPKTCRVRPFDHQRTGGWHRRCGASWCPAGLWHHHRRGRNRCIPRLSKAASGAESGNH